MECVINDLSIYYEEYGQGKPILCVHGFPVDHQIMSGSLEPFFETLEGYRRIYVDLPGMGKTPPRDWIRNADDMLALLEVFAHKILGDTSFLIIGESYGGYLSLGMALRGEVKLDGAFFICPCTIANHAKRKLPRKGPVREEQPLTIDKDDEENFADFLRTAVIVTEETWEQYKTWILPGLSRADQAFTAEYLRGGYSFSFEQKMKTMVFDKPACILTGRQDNSVGYEDAWDICRCFPKATFSVFDSAGHNLQIERVLLFQAHIEDWLYRVSMMEGQ